MPQCTRFSVRRPNGRNTKIEQSGLGAQYRRARDSLLMVGGWIPYLKISPWRFSLMTKGRDKRTAEMLLAHAHLFTQQRVNNYQAIEGSDSMDGHASLCIELTS